MSGLIKIMTLRREGGGGGAYSGLLSISQSKEPLQRADFFSEDLPSPQMTH